MNTFISKPYELLLGIHISYLYEYPNQRENFDFIEIPPIKYVNDIINLININKYPEVIKYLNSYTDESLIPTIALNMNDNYELSEEEIDYSKYQKYLEYKTLKDFANEIKKIAFDINWDSFFEAHKDFYNSMIERFSKFPSNLSLEELKKLYGISNAEFNYIPSVLMNGGFGISNKSKTKLFYNRGFVFDKKINDFYFDQEYLCECLFHEFSHPFINDLVDENFEKFEFIEDLYENAIKHNLPKTYHNPKALLYEYFVRINALYFVQKYFKYVDFSSWIKEHGFSYIEELYLFTKDNLPKYDNYTQFFENEMINYFNERLSNRIRK